MNNYEKLIEKKSILEESNINIYEQIENYSQENFAIEISEHEINPHFRQSTYVKYILNKEIPFGLSKNQNFISIFNFKDLIDSSDPIIIQEIASESIELQRKISNAHKLSRYISSIGSFTFTLYFFFNLSTEIINSTEPIFELIIHYLIFKSIKEGTHQLIKHTIINKQTFETQRGLSFHENNVDQLAQELEVTNIDKKEETI